MTPLERRLRKLQPLLLLALTAGLLAPGCSYKQRNILFKDKDHLAYYKEMRETGAAVIKLKPDTSNTQFVYRLAPDDQIALQFINFDRETLERDLSVLGSATIATTGPTGAGQAGGGATGSYLFTIDGNGDLALPLIGRFRAAGMTSLELRNLLEERYREYNRNALLFLRVITMRAVLLGEVSQVVTLPDERTHLTEVISLAGGMPPTVKTKKIQIIRGDLRDPQVIWVDLTQFQALASPDLYIRPNDIIYFEPRPAPQFVRQAAPYFQLLNLLSLVNTIILVTNAF